jgi:hypothetical protein
MPIAEVRFGREIAQMLPDRAQNVAHTTSKIASLQDLLDALQADPPKHIAMLRSTASRLSEFHNKTCDEITIEAIDLDRDEFRHYLRQRKYATNSVRAYPEFASRLVNHAKRIGWVTLPMEVPPEWAPVMPMIERLNLKQIVRYLVRQGRTPGTLCEGDLANWIGLEVKRGLALKTAEHKAQVLRRLLVSAGPHQPSAKRVRKSRYGVPLDSFPAPLRTEVTEIIRGRQSRFVRSRGKGAPIRPSRQNHFSTASRTYMDSQ